MDKVKRPVAGCFSRAFARILPNTGFNYPVFLPVE